MRSCRPRSSKQMLLQKAEELDLYLLANIRPESSGLPMTIWVSEHGNARHGPPIKVSLQHGDKLDPYHTASVSIGDDPELVAGNLGPQELRAVQAYVRLNKTVLLAYWSGEIDTFKLASHLKALPL
jgi:hypothetical protein